MYNSNNLVFNSISELVEDLDKAPVISSRDDSSNDRRTSGWCDTDSYEEARKCLINGKVYSGLENDINEYRSKGTAFKRNNELSVVGHNVVVPLYLQGIPNCMITSKQKLNNKIVTICYSPQASAGVPNNTLIKGATKLFKNIISLEEEGYRVNLYLVEVQDGFGYAIKLKSDRETLNLKKLCFPIISSSMLRRIGFRIKERLYKDWIGGGYGSGCFYRGDYEVFIRKNLRLQRYEIWNYEGKQYEKTA